MKYSRSSDPRLYSLVPPTPKPPQICRAPAKRGRGLGDMQWARAERTHIEATVAQIGLTEKRLGTTLQIRDARPQDFAQVRALIQRCFGTTFPASGYQVLWALRCGRGAVVKTAGRELMGVHMETPAADRDHSSYSIGACVDARVRGFRLSGRLARYTGLRAFMDGARVRRGITSPTNVGSCVVLLHEVGANFVRLHTSFADFGAPRFEYALELSRAGLSSQCVDRSSLATWLDTKPACAQLIPIDDHDQLASLLKGQGHHIVALCRDRGAYVIVHGAPTLHAATESRP